MIGDILYVVVYQVGDLHIYKQQLRQRGRLSTQCIVQTTGQLHNNRGNTAPISVFRGKLKGRERENVSGLKFGKYEKKKRKERKKEQTNE